MLDEVLWRTGTGSVSVVEDAVFVRKPDERWNPSSDAAKSSVDAFQPVSSGDGAHLALGLKFKGVDRYLYIWGAGYGKGESPNPLAKGSFWFEDVAIMKAESKVGAAERRRSSVNAAMGMSRKVSGGVGQRRPSVIARAAAGGA